MRAKRLLMHASAALLCTTELAGSGSSLKGRRSRIRKEKKEKEKEKKKKKKKNKGNDTSDGSLSESEDSLVLRQYCSTSMDRVPVNVSPQFLYSG